MTRFWDEIALTDYEDRAVHAFRKILGINVERIAVVGNGFRASIKDKTRRILVKVSNHSQPVPLKSLGMEQFAFSVSLWHWQTAEMDF